MTLPKDIQSLIDELDRVFPTVSAEFAESLLPEEIQQHQVLDKVRHYLQSFEEPRPEGETLPDESTAATIASAVIAQINVQRGEWLTPLQMELQALRQQRESMLRELNQLQRQRQVLIAEFMDGLRERCLTIVRETMAEGQNQPSETSAASFWTAAPVSSPTSSPGLEQIENSQFNQIENIRQLQQQSDKMLMSLDATFHQVLNTLEKDLQAYQTALSQEMEELYQLGRENLGEVSVSPSPKSGTDAYPFAGVEVESSPATPVESHPQTASSGVESFPFQEGRIESQISSLFDLEVDPLSSEPEPVPQSEANSQGTAQIFDSDQFQTSSGITAFNDPIIAKISGQDPESPEALFAGLDDPATHPPSPSSSPQDLFTDSPSETQSLESVSETELPDLTEEKTVVTIESLLDLVDQVVFDQEETTTLEQNASMDTEGYVPVSPQENLLDVNESESAKEEDFPQVLGENFMANMKEDLQQFEEVTEAAPSPEVFVEESLEPSESSGITEEPSESSGITEEPLESSGITEEPLVIAEAVPEEFITENQELQQMPLEELEEEAIEVEVEVIGEDESFDPWDSSSSSKTPEDKNPPQ